MRIVFANKYLVGSVSIDEDDFFKAGGPPGSVRWSEEYGGSLFHNDRDI